MCAWMQVFLNLVLEFVPDTVYRISKHYSKAGQRMPSIYVKLYTYQVGPRRVHGIPCLSSTNTHHWACVFPDVQLINHMIALQNTRKAGGLGKTVLGCLLRNPASLLTGAHFCPCCRCVVRWHTSTRRASATGTLNRRWVRHQSAWRQSLFLASKPASSCHMPCSIAASQTDGRP